MFMISSLENFLELLIHSQKIIVFFSPSKLIGIKMKEEGNLKVWISNKLDDGLVNNSEFTRLRSIFFSVMDFMVYFQEIWT